MPGRTRPRRSGRRYWWTRLGDEELLDLRFCDLGLALDRSPLARHVEQLYAELGARGIAFRPHCWLGEEWFSPDGVPGFALPFFLAHPRLRRLERRMLGEVEGGNRNWFMRILRHEAGHAVDNAYRLRRRRVWRETFGPAGLPYPDSYRPRPGSRRYVQHLGSWYAQSHPTEDFAETFAVWLKPGSRWRSDYRDWPALGKLEVVDALMAGIAAQPAPVRSRIHIDSLAHDTRTLRQHYAAILKRYAAPSHRDEDELLERVFTTEPGTPALRAATFLRRLRPRLHPQLVARVGCSEYLVHQVMRAAIRRCTELGLYVRGDRRRAARNAEWALARLVRSFERSAGRRLTL
ncbi:MAG: putative zinc-binding metallopeptidase [Proteobacteria bacterium]|nr:putative zinc-binding metallopeptidase [Pseudomonadota bacterium]